MIYKALSGKFLLRFDLGDDFFAEFERFYKETNCESGFFEGIGAFKTCELGYYQIDKKDYLRKGFSQTLEVISLEGNLALVDNKPTPHVHVILSNQDFSCIGGHLLHAIIGGTLEIVFEKSSNNLSRKYNEAIGLKLLDI
jgi:predicted DNA-binding protein with PD1-like motif